MTEWKMSELNSVKTLTESDLEKTVGGDNIPLLTGVGDLFKIFKGKNSRYNGYCNLRFLPCASMYYGNGIRL